MLLGRESESARVGELLAAARAGASGALVIRGEPGIGKSALLEQAVERATGITVVRVRGVQSESELAFAGLADLLTPLLADLEALPPPQAAVLASVLALGPPAAADRFTVSAATLSLLAATAERAPLLAIVDDAAWIDGPSREALAFVARRLAQEGIVLLLAARTGEYVGCEPAEVPELVLGGLDLAASTALLGAAIAPRVAERLFDTTGGNPLALLELSALLSDAQRAGTEAIEDPAPVGASVERAYARELDAVPAVTRRALLVAAASDSGAAGEILAALRAGELGPDALGPAERAGLIAIADAKVRFRHPLLRSVAYRTMPAPDRRAAHRMLAAVLDGGRAAERRAWHLAAAAVGPDEDVAGALMEAAAAARRRGGPAAAVQAGARAARLTPDPARRAARLLEAATDVARVGPPERAHDLLAEALALEPEPLLRADVQHLRGLLEARSGHAGAAAELLVAEASRIVELDAARAATMLLAAVQPCFQAGRSATALAIAERAEALAREAGLPPMPAAVPLAMMLLLSGRRETARPPLVRAAEWLEQADDPWALGPVIHFGIGQAFCWVEDYEPARRLLTGGIAQARAWSAPGLLPYGLLSLAELEFRTGGWVAAYAHADEAVELARQTGQPNDEGYALGVLARIEAALGRDVACRGHLARGLELFAQRGAEMGRCYLDAVHGFLALGLGRSERAIAALEDVAAFLGERPPQDPNVLQWAPDLVEAYARVGRAADAAATLAALESEAPSGGWARAVSARCHGLLAREDEFDARFQAALALHDTPFDAARTHLCFGERLRRAGRRVEARAQLRAALEAFDRLGARPWGKRARVELRATGERVTRRAPEATDRLTPQELQVALAVTGGATNREAAAALFLSPKTIEFHLRNIYRKLGVRSRTELVRIVLSGEME